MSTSSEFSLLQQARAFDLQTLGTIYDRYSPLVYRCAYRVLNDAQLAEDCVAEVFGQFLHALGSKGERIREIEQYLIQAAIKWVHIHLQSQQPIDDDDDDDDDDDVVTLNLPNDRVEAEDVRAGLKEMSLERRTVLLLKFLESWDDQQIAAVLDLPAGNLHDQYKQALNALSRSLTGSWGEPLEAQP